MQCIVHRPGPRHVPASGGLHPRRAQSSTSGLPQSPRKHPDRWEEEMDRQKKRGNAEVARCIAEHHIDPEKARVKGNQHFMEGDYHRAVQCYKASLAGRSTAKVHCNLASACLRLGEYDEAVASSRKAIEVDPLFGKAYFRLARALQAKGGDDSDGALLHAAAVAKAMFPHDADVRDEVAG
eukprot:Sspe_Gene.48573::Locus_25413_Transcript_1_1_Confidence_1.000_Length_4431::g.48573::m.48573